MSFFKNHKQDFTIDKDRLPNHISFIIDGNGRWATKRGMPRTFGHRAGVEAVKDTINNCYSFGIKYVSFFCFSTENWNRPQDEVDALFEMLRDFIKEDITPYKDKGIKFVISGDITSLPQDLQTAINDAVEQTKNSSAMVVNLCINYGGQSEIVDAVNCLLKEGKKQITLDDFNNQIYKNGLCPIDLVVRTSGEQRISNFMLYEIAYAELYFTDTYWPDFNMTELKKALKDFTKRNRRFGAIKK